jgi:EmrB/QacA subfamily drug resistance transporter
MDEQARQRTGLDPQLLRLGLVLVVGIFMSMLDTTIVNVSLRTIGRDFGAGLTTLQWVVTGYMLALAVVIPTTGWLVDHVGARRLFVTSTALFTAGSVLCACAWDLDSLIVFRVLQGAGGALLMPIAQTVLARAAGPDRMGRVMMVVGVPALLAPVLGPVAGGLIVDNVSWRWIFLINLPVGVVSVWLSSRLLPADVVSATRQRFDFTGLGLVGPGLALLIYGLSHAGSTGTLAATPVWVTMAAGALLCLGYVPYAARRGLSALIPLAFLRDRAFAGSAAVSLAIGISVFGVMLLLPLYYQQIRGDSALMAGVLLAPQGLGTAISMPIAGALTDRFGARWVVVIGMTTVTATTVALAFTSLSTSAWLLAVVLVTRGAGFGATMMPAMSGGYANLPKTAAGHASSVLQIFSRVGGTFGGALMAVILTQTIHTDHARTAAQINRAFDTTFWWATGIAVAGTAVAFLLPGTAPQRAQITPGEQEIPA